MGHIHAILERLLLVKVWKVLRTSIDCLERSVYYKYSALSFWGQSTVLQIIVPFLGIICLFHASRRPAVACYF